MKSAPVPRCLINLRNKPIDTLFLVITILLAAVFSGLYIAIRTGICKILRIDIKI